MSIVGDVGEERAQPTTLIVAPFDDNHPDFIFMRMCHAQRAAVASAGFGMSFVILMFISAFFEFDWYHHKKGVDLVALLTLFFYLALGVLIHYYVLLGVKHNCASYLLPFIIVYMVIIGSESVAALYPLMHIRSTHGFWLGDDSRNVFILTFIMFLIIVSIQSIMLAAVCKCRLYLSCKHAHITAMKVAEKSRCKYPGIQILLANDHRPVNGTVANENVTRTQQVNDDDNTNVDQRSHEVRSSYVQQINTQMQFESSAQPPPYAAAASSTYAYDQPNSHSSATEANTTTAHTTLPPSISDK
ncbi:unnamed protein product [Anisakis simplex]|uniref:MARVEL domain-containing protein n=1 Tax=Anisakis simplex TaxID=6269 RepID=A0A0M3JU96_ANISI|nr:unnamed protein product [Anisakis simplex]